MEKEQELSNILGYLGNLEGDLFKLEELQDLLVILEEGYFDKDHVDLNNASDMYTLWRDYKYRQSLLFTINRCLNLYNSELSESIYKIYDSVKSLRSQSFNDNQKISNINKIVAQEDSLLNLFCLEHLSII